MSDEALFDRDDHPGALRILFVGAAQSSHTHGWIRLLDGAPVNVRLFSSMPDDLLPPQDFAPRTYLTIPGLRLSTANRRNLLGGREKVPPPKDAFLAARFEECRRAIAYGPEWLLETLSAALLAAQDEGERRGQAREQLRDFRLTRPQRARTMLQQLRQLVSPQPAPPELLAGEPLPCLSPEPLEAPLLPAECAVPEGAALAGGPAPVTAEAALLEVIEHWRPHIVHTFGFYDLGRWFHDIHRRHALGRRLRWVMQFRGGSDLTLKRYLPAAWESIAAAARDADRIVNDNLTHKGYLQDCGIPLERFASITPVPGSGGMEIPASLAGLPPPSARRIILWPKTYTTQFTDALPVLEALRLAWDRLPPCRIVMLWTVQQDLLEWIEALPPEIRAACEVHGRVPREQVLGLMREARVMLAPSLIDGRPNVVFEAMASGAFPVVSPLPTITEFAAAPDNVLFAGNLYPQEIADALVRAMTDDALVDQAVERNLALVRQVADRAAIAPRVLAFYQALAAEPT